MTEVQAKWGKLVALAETESVQAPAVQVARAVKGATEEVAEVARAVTRQPWRTPEQSRR